MADPQRREKILTAARQVFAAEGYDKASIQKIARTASLKSSALIYWYFENKEALFQAVMIENVPLAQLDEVFPSFFRQPPEIVLPQLLQWHLAALENEERRQLIKIVVPEALRNEALGRQLTDLINPIFDIIKQYLERQIEDGRFRPHDTNISVRALLSISAVYALNKLMLPNLGDGLPEQDTYITEAVTIFIQGLS